MNNYVLALAPAPNAQFYGVSGLFRDPDGGGAHGLNERIRVSTVYEGREFLYALIKTYADQK